MNHNRLGYGLHFLECSPSSISSSICDNNHLCECGRVFKSSVDVVANVRRYGDVWFCSQAL